MGKKLADRIADLEARLVQSTKMVTLVFPTMSSTPEPLTQEDLTAPPDPKTGRAWISPYYYCGFIGGTQEMRRMALEEMRAAPGYQQPKPPSTR